MKIFFCIVSMISVTGCVTLTVGDDFLGKNQEASSTVMFGIENHFDGGYVGFSNETTIMNLATKEEYKINYQKGREVHELKVLHLPHGIYALVENSSSVRSGSYIETINCVLPPEDAPWFLAMANKTLYLGQIIYDYPSSSVRVMDDEARVKQLLSEANRPLDYNFMPLALSDDAKKSLKFLESSLNEQRPTK